MSKLWVAICFFFLGCMFSALIGPVLAKEQGAGQVSDEHRMVFTGGESTGARSSGMFAVGAEPTFRPLQVMPIFKEYLFSHEPQPLDGLDCRGCTFDDVSLTYGGGAFNLVNAKFTGTTTLKFVGAAANTLAFVDFMQHIAKGLPGVPLPPNKPITKETIAKKPMTQMNVTAPYIGK